MVAKTGHKEKTNFISVLQQHAVDKGDRLAYTFLKNRGEKVDSINFRQLDEKVRILAAYLQTHYQPNSRFLLLMPSGIEYVISFLACLYAGMVAVPAYPPVNIKQVPRLLTIFKDSGAAIILTFSAIADKLVKLATDYSLPLSMDNCLCVDQVTTDANDWKMPTINDDQLALLQYTSGSTAEPKGVMLTQGNLLYNEAMVKVAFGHDEDTVFASWLPLFHDMGLIGNILQPLYLGVHCVFMAPETFIQKPYNWLKAISDYGVTTSGGPTFGYDMCIAKITEEEKQTLDLSKWKVAFCGAQPISAGTVTGFIEKFGDCNFNSGTFFPCFGLAEASLFVTGGPAGRVPTIKSIDKNELVKNNLKLSAQASDDTQAIVCCGPAWLDEDIAIVDPITGKVCAEDKIGEIWIAGAHVGKGYWQNEQATQEIFNAYTTDTNKGPYMRSGDLGFMLDDELYVTGRIKNLIIIRGQNYYPQDIEQTVQDSHKALRPHAGAAFGIENGDGEEERLVVIHELDPRYKDKVQAKQIYDDIIAAVAKAHGLTVYDIAIVSKGGVEKTSSGKIQRSNSKQQYLQGKLPLAFDTYRSMKQQSK